MTERDAAGEPRGFSGSPGTRVLHSCRREGPPPAVTVCVTLFQYGQYVLECLQSVVQQTLAPLGLIVVDDASIDGGPELVARWLDEDGGKLSEALLLQHETNGGLAAARNTAVAHARSEFVFILDADNELYPRCIEALLEPLRESGCGFAYSILERFGDLRGLMGCDGWNPEQLTRGNYIDAMVLLRRSIWETFGGYRRMQVPGWEDFDFWCRCAEAGVDGVLVPEILARYRTHTRSMLRRATDTLRNHARVRGEIRSMHPWVEF